MAKYRKVVSLDDERDVDYNTGLQSNNPETLFAAWEEKIEEDKRNQEITGLLEDVIQNLPELQRSIIIIRYYLQGEDRYTAQQIADALEISVKTYYNHLNRALGALRNHLAAEPIIQNHVVKRK